jgi:3-keto-disaccharide hydrolase
MLRRSILLLAVLALAALPARSQEWKQIFNGKDLTGWKQVGPGHFEVENGMLKPIGGMGLLYYTGGKIKNSVIRVVFKVTKADDNAGVFIRIPLEPREEWMPVNYGYEVQIYDAGDDYHCTGVLYSMTKEMARASKPVGEWNTMEITLDGPHTVVVLNGQKVTDYTEGQPVPEPTETYEPQRGRRPDAGYIGLQNHPRDDKSSSGAFFKEVAIKALKK